MAKLNMYQVITFVHQARFDAIQTSPYRGYRFDKESEKWLVGSMNDRKDREKLGSMIKVGNGDPGASANDIYAVARSYYDDLMTGVAFTELDAWNFEFIMKWWREYYSEPKSGGFAIQPIPNPNGCDGNPGDAELVKTILSIINKTANPELIVDYLEYWSKDVWKIGEYFKFSQEEFEQMFKIRDAERIQGMHRSYAYYLTHLLNIKMANA